MTVYRAAVAGEDEIREVEYEAVADALHFACRDLREGRRVPIEIVEDGQVLYDAEGIAAVCRQMEEDRSTRTAEDAPGGPTSVA